MDTPQNQVIKCPITSLPIKVPIKNTLCDHVYEKEAVLNFFENMQDHINKDEPLQNFLLVCQNLTPSSCGNI